MEDHEPDPSTGDDENTVRFEREYNTSLTKPSTAIIEFIAEIEGSNPIELVGTDGITLHDSVDPGAVDSLLSHNEEDPLTIAFPIGGYFIQIDKDAVLITHREGDAPSLLTSGSEK